MRLSILVQRSPSVLVAGLGPSYGVWRSPQSSACLAVILAVKDEALAPWTGTTVVVSKLHPVEVKAKALAIYVDEGGAEASRQTGVPAVTIRSWAHRTGVATVARERTQAATEAARCRWEERRVELADQIGAAAELVLVRTVEALAGGKTRDAKDTAVTVASAGT